VYTSGNAVAATCAATAGAIQLTSGAAVPFSTATSYNYCADYASVGTGGLGAWSVSWTAP
jgi:hypothetical protein